MYKNFYCYPAVFEQNNESIGVYFPDFDVCVSGGNSVEEAVKNSKEALSLHLYGMEQDRDILPDPACPQDIKLERNEYIIMIDVNYKLFRDKQNRKSVDRMVTLPSYLNAVAKERGINISQVLQEALKKQLNI